MTDMYTPRTDCILPAVYVWPPVAVSIQCPPLPPNTSRPRRGGRPLLPFARRPVSVRDQYFAIRRCRQAINVDNSPNQCPPPPHAALWRRVPCSGGARRSSGRSGWTGRGETGRRMLACGDEEESLGSPGSVGAVDVCTVWVTSTTTELCAVTTAAVAAAAAASRQHISHCSESSLSTAPIERRVQSCIWRMWRQQIATQHLGVPQSTA